MKNDRVLCVGGIVADVFLNPAVAAPAAHELVYAQRIELHAGGDAANNAVVMARLGVHVTFVGAVGLDDFGDYLEKKLKEEGLARVRLARKSEPTSSCIVSIFPDGEHSFIFSPGANNALSIGDVPESFLEDAGFLHVGSAFCLDRLDGRPMGELFKGARSKGIHTSFDIGAAYPEKVPDLIKYVLPYANMALPSLAEARSVTGRVSAEDCAKALVDFGVEKAVIKSGARGACVHDGSRLFWADAFKVRVADTTGAGDTFAAAFLAALSRGEPLEQCARFANAASALCIQAVGATAGAKSREEVLNFIKNCRP